MTQTHRPTTADVIAWFKDERSRREAAEERIATLEAALRDIAQTASDGADALVTRDRISTSRRALIGRFDSIADAALATLEEDSHDG